MILMNHCECDGIIEFFFAVSFAALTGLASPAAQPHQVLVDNIGMICLADLETNLITQCRLRPGSYLNLM